MNSWRASDSDGSIPCGVTLFQPMLSQRSWQCGNLERVRLLARAGRVSCEIAPDTSNSVRFGILAKSVSSVVSVSLKERMRLSKLVSLTAQVNKVGEGDQNAIKQQKFAHILSEILEILLREKLRYRSSVQEPIAEGIFWISEKLITIKVIVS